MFKQYLKLTIYGSLIAVILSYIIMQTLIYKGNQEIENTRVIISSIHQLKDLHTICILDYKYNTANIEYLKECKKIETKMVSAITIYNEKTPYLNFYKKYIQGSQ